MNVDPYAIDGDIFLRQLNKSLAQEHKLSLKRGQKERFATIHVVGLPRSGTTLLMQLLASSFELNYPTNLSATLWEAPLYGAALARKLFTGEFESSYQSSYGRTQDLREPHEFGRFWLKLLNYDSLEEKPGHKIDCELVRDTLVGMTEVAGGPYAFKSFLPVWHLEELSHICKKSLIIHVKRDPMENAISLLKARRCYADEETNWVGLKPYVCRKFEHESIHVQVASQVIAVEHSIMSKTKNLPDNRVLTFDLDEILRSTESVISTINSRVSTIQESDIIKPSFVAPLLNPSGKSPTSKSDVEALNSAFKNLQTAMPEEAQWL